MKKSEHEIQNEIRIAVGKEQSATLFRANVGEAWTGTTRGIDGCRDERHGDARDGRQKARRVCLSRGEEARRPHEQGTGEDARIPA